MCDILRYCEIARNSVAYMYNLNMKGLILC